MTELNNENTMMNYKMLSNINNDAIMNGNELGNG